MIADLHGAVFLDAGNVWLMRKDENRPNGEFTLKNFPKQIALGTGFGLRYDLDFPVISCIVPPSGMGKTFVAHYFPLATASPLAQGHRNTYGQSGIKSSQKHSLQRKSRTPKEFYQIKFHNIICG